MGTSLGSLSDAAVAAVLMAIFVMVLVVARNALKEMELFGECGSWVLAFCTAALSVLGLVRFLGPQEQDARAESTPAAPDGVMDFLLLPYAALAIAILLVLLLFAWGKARPDRRVKPWEQSLTKPIPGIAALTEKDRAAARTSLRRRLEK
jgi:succinate dehydrogenase hydrophobic anchor subunit